MSIKFNKLVIDEMTRLMAEIKRDTEGQDPAEYVNTRRDFAECMVESLIILAEQNITLHRDRDNFYAKKEKRGRALMRMAKELANRKICYHRLHGICPIVSSCGSSEREIKLCWLRYTLRLEA